MQSEDREPPQQLCSVGLVRGTRAHNTALLRFAFVVGSFVAFDLLAPPILLLGSRTSPLILGFFGGVMAQGGLIAIWAALGTTTYWPIRQLQALLLAFLAAWCLWLGFGTSEFTALPLTAFVVAAAYVPLLLLAAQLPLWTWRLIRAWRIVPASVGRAGADAVGRQFDLRDLLLAALVVAVPLGSVRFGLRLIPNDVNPGQIAILMLVTAITSALTMLPCTWTALGAARHDVGCFAIVLYSLVLAITVYLASVALSGGGEFEVLTGLMSLSFAATGITYLALLAFRDCGYRLQSVRERAIACDRANENGSASQSRELGTESAAAIAFRRRRRTMSADARPHQATDAFRLPAAWRRLPVLARAALLAAAFLLADLGAPFLIDHWRLSRVSGILIGLFGAIVIAQFGLLAVWATLGPQRWYVRLSLSLALALSGCACFYAGAAGAGAYLGGWGRFTPIAATLPMICLAFQAPLWACRIGRGWTLSPSAEAATQIRGNAQRYRLVDLFFATIVIAVAIEFARRGIQPAESGLIMVLSAFFGGALISAFTTAPASCCALDGKHGASSGLRFANIALFAWAAFVPLVRFVTASESIGFAAAVFLLVLVCGASLMHVSLVALSSDRYVLVSNLSRPPGEECTPGPTQPRA